MNANAKIVLCTLWNHLISQFIYKLRLPVNQAEMKLNKSLHMEVKNNYIKIYSIYLLKAIKSI